MRNIVKFLHLLVRKEITKARPIKSRRFSHATAQYVLSSSIDHANGAGIASLSCVPIAMSFRAWAFANRLPICRTCMHVPLSLLPSDEDRVLLLISGILLSRRVVLRTGGGAISTWSPSRLDLHQNTMPIDPTTYGLWYRYDARFFSSSIYVRVEPLDETVKWNNRRDNAANGETRARTTRAHEFVKTYIHINTYKERHRGKVMYVQIHRKFKNT